VPPGGVPPDRSLRVSATASGCPGIVELDNRARASLFVEAVKLPERRGRARRHSVCFTGDRVPEEVRSMRVDGWQSASSPVELAADPARPDDWMLSVQVPPTEIPRFTALLERREPIEVTFRLDELERHNVSALGDRLAAGGELRGTARLESFPHTDAGGSARFRGAGELRAAA
jgi:hypothetical protein